MATNQGDEYVKLGVQTDDASFNKLDQKVAASQSKMEALGRANDQVSTSAAKLGSTIGAVTQKMGEGERMTADFTKFMQGYETQVKSADNSLKQFIKTYEELLEQDEIPFDPIGSSGGGKSAGPETFRRAGGALNQLGLGEAGQPLQRIGDIAEIKKVIGEVGDSFTELPGILGSVATAGSGVAGGLGAVLAVAGPLVAAAGAVAIAFKLVNDQAAETEKGIQRGLSTQKGYYDAVASLTTEQAEKHLEVLKRQAAAQQQATDETERSLKILEHDTGISRNVGIAAPGAVGDAFRDLTKQLDDNKKTVDETNSSIGRFTGGLESNAFAANDALDAEQKLADYRKQESSALLASLDKQAADEIEMARLRREGSSKQIESIIATNKDRIDALNTESGELIRIGDTSDEAQKKLGDLIAEINRLTAQNEELTSKVLPARKAQEEYTESLKEFTKDLLDLDAVNEKVKAGLADLKSKYEDQTADTNAKRRLASERDEADFTRKRLYALTDNAKKLAVEDTDYYTTRSKKIRDFALSQKQTEDKANAERLKDIQTYGESQRQAAIDYGDKVAEIEAKSRNSRIDDAAHLDARALDQELRGRKQQLDSATKTYTTEQAKKKEALDKQLAELVANTTAEEQQRAEAFRLELQDEDQQYQTKRSREIAAFNDQLSREDSERRIALQRQQENFKLEDAARKAAYNQQVQNLKDQLLKPMEKVQSDSFQTQIKSFKTQVDSQIQLAAHAWSVFMAGFRPNSSPYYTPQSFQTTQQKTSSLQRKLMPGYADGGVPPLYTPVMVGERGPEPVIFTQPARILPSGSAAGGGSTVNFYGPLYLNGDLASPAVYGQVKQLMHRAYTEMRGG